MRSAFVAFFVVLGQCVTFPVVSFAEQEKMFVFNSDGGAARIAHVRGQPVRDVVCNELNEMDGTAVTDFFWCPIVGGNVFIYPTNVGERMGDNIRDWAEIHPFYRDMGRAMAENLTELIKGGDDPIDMLAERAEELGIRFWLTCRMNEIHEDDDRFMVLRSLFKEKHLDWLHGKDYHPAAIYAPKKDWSYAWDYGHEGVRNHFLKLFEEWLAYDIDGIELDYQRSPCLFPPGEQDAGAPKLTEFMVKLRAAADAVGERRQKKIQLAVRVPPSFERCKAAGIEIETWVDRQLVDVIIPMERGYFDSEPNLPEFLAVAKSNPVVILGGVEPLARGYKQSNELNYGAVSNFFYQGTAGIYTFNYDCHRVLNSGWKFGGNVHGYTPDELAFLTHALDPAIVHAHDKLYVVTQDTMHRLVEDGGLRPLKCRLPVGDVQTFTMTIGDDLAGAAREGLLRASRLNIKLKGNQGTVDQLDFAVNGVAQSPKNYIFETRESNVTVITLVNPPLQQGANTIRLGLKPGSSEGGIIDSIDVNIDYWSPEEQRKNIPPDAQSRRWPIMGDQQLFAYIPNCLEIYVKEPRYVAEPSDWPANILRFQFPESVNAIAADGRRMWEFSFENSDHAWRVVSKADEKTMGGIFKNRVMECEDRIEGQAVIRRTATWSKQQIDFQLNIQNLGNQPIQALRTSMCLQRTAAPDYIDHDNSRTFLVSHDGFVANRELAHHPKKMNFYGHVGRNLEVVDPNSPRTLAEPVLFVISSDRRYVLCYGWRGANMVFMNRAPRVRCLHSEFGFEDIAPHKEVVAEGILFVQEGTLEQALQRFLAWKQQG